MPLRIPFKPTTFDIEQAAKKNSWRGFANALRRNFEEIEMVVQTNDNALDALDTRLDTAEASLTYLGNKQVYTVQPTASRTTSSTSFVDWPAGEVLSANFEKLSADTRLLISVVCGGWANGAAEVVFIGVNVDGTDHTIRKGVYQNAIHTDLVGEIEVTGIAAGIIPLTLRMRGSLGNQIVCDTNDQVYMVVEEVPA